MPSTDTGPNVGTAPDCTFCGRQAESVIYAHSDATGPKHQVPLCDEHWMDYVEVTAP